MATETVELSLANIYPNANEFRMSGSMQAMSMSSVGSKISYDFSQVPTVHHMTDYFGTDRSKKKSTAKVSSYSRTRLRRATSSKLESFHFAQHHSPAFGRCQRFVSIGLHPGLDAAGCMMKNTNPGPGTYDFDVNFRCRYKLEQESVWTRELNVADFARNLGYQNPKILAERQEVKKQLGPASKDVPIDYYKRTSNNAKENVSFGTVSRFKYFDDALPGPATYMIKQTKTHFNAGKSNWNQSDRFADSDTRWSIPPNRYKYKDTGCIQALLDKVVSKRGPYDLFTGPRSDENMFNKFSYGKRCSPDKMYTAMMDVDYLLHHKNMARCGKFLKAMRFPKKPTTRMMLQDLSLCYHDPKDPGPDRYNIAFHTIKAQKESAHAFGLTGFHDRNNMKWTTMPGPGRYNVTYPKCGAKKKNNESWVFKSKTKRTEHKAPTYNSF